MFAGLASFCIFLIYSREEGAFWMTGFMIVLGLLWARDPLSSWRYWRTYGGTTFFTIDQDRLVGGDIESQSDVAIPFIEKVLIKRRRGHVKSVSIRIKSGSRTQIEGFQNMDRLAKEIANVVGPDKTKEVKFFLWWH